MKRRWLRVAAVVAAVLATGGLVLALTNASTDSSDRATHAFGAGREGRGVFTLAGGQLSPGERAFPAAVRRQARRLSLERQVAQLFAVGFDGQFPRAPFFGQLRRRGWGAVVLERRNFVDEAQLGALAGEAHKVARDARLIEPIVAAPQTGGDSSAFPGLPPKPEQKTGGAASARSEALSAAGRLRGLGVGMTLAPIADLGSELGGDAYSSDPAVAARMTAAAVAGYRRGGVAAAVGHFPGQGSASQDPQAGPATVGLALADLRARDVRPFGAVARRVPAVVISNALYTAYDGATPAVLLPEVYALLRRKLGFRGVAMSDDLLGTQAATGGSVGSAAVDALRAGADLVYVSGGPAEQEQAYRAVLRAVRRGALPRARLRFALLRVLTLKRRYAVP